MKNIVIVCFFLLPNSPSSLFAQDKIDSTALEILKHCSDYLQQIQEMNIDAEVTVDLLDEDMHKLQFTKYVQMQIKRPQHLHVEVNGDLEERRFWCNSKQLTILDKQDEVHYATLKVEGSLDETLNEAIDEFGIDLPLADIVYSDAFAGVFDAIIEGHYIDESRINGFDCHHLAFYQDNIDWQIWIEEGSFPVPRKILLNYKNYPGEPQHVIEFLKIDIFSQLPDHIFQFTPPPGSIEIELLKVEN